jgi:phosphoribosylglycinamide formyltransferase-1
MMRLAVLVSGRGSNLEAVLSAVADGQLRGVEPVLVVSNRPGARALDVAEEEGVPWTVLRRSAFASVEARDAAIGAALTDSGADLALLAGYDQLLRPAYFAAFHGRTINIHPSLLPRHGGRGMMGLAVHRAVIESHDPETGVTVHEVNHSLDAGAPIAQVRVPVLDGDTAERLAERVLASEHRLLVEVLARLAAEAEPIGPSASMAAALPPAAEAGATHERR